MEKREFEEKWPKLKKSMKAKWKELMDEDFDEIHGNYQQFVSKLQEKYDLSKEQAEEAIRNWVHDEKESSKNKKMWGAPKEEAPKHEKKRKAG